jgi:hypothetical protein
MKKFLSMAVVVLAMVSGNSIAAGKGASEENNIEKYEVVVAGANDEWTPTTIKVVSGDILLIKSSGKIKAGNWIGEVTADGDQNGVGRLQIKIGPSKIQTVGTLRYVPINEAGTVKLRVEDSNYRDNSGELSVEVIKIPASLIPEARKVVAE